MSKMLEAPILAQCADRSIQPKAHSRSGTPEAWLGNEILRQEKIFGFSFDFFVNWSMNPPEISPVIWCKRILNSAYNYADLLPHLESELNESFGDDYLERLLIFSTNHLLRLQIVLFRDTVDWTNEESEILIVSVSKKNDGSTDYAPEIIKLPEFKRLIQTYSGGPVQIGSKGLIFGTSRLECALSKTSALYPGDMDLLLTDEASKPLAILELKKHTLATPIKDQQLSNYYPHPDKRKYDRLAIFKSYIESFAEKIPILVLYYPTKDEFTEFKLELLQGDAGILAVMAKRTYPLPASKTAAEYSAIVKTILKAIEYFHLARLKVED